MKFLTKEEVSEYYSKPFDMVSPTDTPQDYYIVGHGQFSYLTVLIRATDYRHIAIKRFKYPHPQYIDR